MNIKVIVNGQSLTETESKQHTRRRVSLHGGVAEICRSRQSAALNTDTLFVARHRAEHPTKRKRQVAIAAARAGLPEDVVYDPTLADKPLDPKAMFESRSAWKRKIAEERAKMRDEDYTKPLHRLHPRLVQEEIKRRAAEDPTVLRRDRRELVAEIVDQHGSKG